MRRWRSAISRRSPRTWPTWPIGRSGALRCRKPCRRNRSTDARLRNWTSGRAGLQAASAPRQSSPASTVGLCEDLCPGGTAGVRTLSPGSRRVIGQLVGCPVVFAVDVRDGEIQRPRQLAASPIQRIQPRAATGVQPGHLLHHDFRIGIHVQRFWPSPRPHAAGLPAGPRIRRRCCPGAQSTWQCAPCRRSPLFDHDANTRGPRISVGTAVDIGHQDRHQLSSIRCVTRGASSRALRGSCSPIADYPAVASVLKR